MTDQKSYTNNLEFYDQKFNKNDDNFDKDTIGKFKIFFIF